MTPNPQSYTNPYLGFEQTELTRVAFFTSTEDLEFITRTLHPGSGTVTIMFNILFVKFCNALRKAGITDHATQRMEFEKFLTECEIKVPKKKQPKGE